MAELRRLGEILQGAVVRMSSGEVGRAYALWLKSCGEPIAAVTEPKRFQRGQLTIECESSIWVSELTLLGGAIVTKMRALDPESPVEKLRFVLARQSRAAAAEPEAVRPDERWKPLAAADLDGARECAEALSDDKLRTAVRAALRASVGDIPPET